MIRRVLGWLLFALVFLAVGVLLVVFVAWLIARSLLRPPRMTDGKAMYLLRRISPKDLDLPYEPVTFNVPDEAQPSHRIDIAGWWIPSDDTNATRCTILLHGFADGKVGAIAWAPMFHELDFHILALDLRAHGESGGEHSTGGYFERHDLVQVIDQLIVTHPDEVKSIVLFGASLGANVALATAAVLESRGAQSPGAQSPEAQSPVTGLVLDCPFSRFGSAVASHARLLGAPTTFVNPLALRLASAMSGAKLDEIDPLEQMRSVKTPMLIVCAGRDVFVGERDRATLEETVSSRSDFSTRSFFWRDDEAPHLLNLTHDPAGYRARLESFCEGIL